MGLGPARPTLFGERHMAAICPKEEIVNPSTYLAIPAGYTGLIGPRVRVSLAVLCTGKAVLDL